MGLFRVNETNIIEVEHRVKNPEWKKSSASIFLFVLNNKNE